MRAYALAAVCAAAGCGAAEPIEAQDVTVEVLSASTAAVSIARKDAPPPLKVPCPPSTGEFNATFASPDIRDLVSFSRWGKKEPLDRVAENLAPDDATRRVVSGRMGPFPAKIATQDNVLIGHYPYSAIAEVSKGWMVVLQANSAKSPDVVVSEILRRFDDGSQGREPAGTTAALDVCGYSLAVPPTMDLYQLSIPEVDGDSLRAFWQDETCERLARDLPPVTGRRVVHGFDTMLTRLGEPQTYNMPTVVLNITLTSVGKRCFTVEHGCTDANCRLERTSTADALIGLATRSTP
ncbi:MAG: hypothetical protein HOW73_22455 [Polyangiaceae bacterium]|nr:hypothetical protein [Polyangiaceae bacterium]